MAESRRPSRKRSSMSAAYYAGYVEDDESPEAIMQKFEMMETLMKDNQVAETETTNEDQNPQQELLEKIARGTLGEYSVDRFAKGQDPSRLQYLNDDDLQEMLEDEADEEDFCGGLDDLESDSYDEGDDEEDGEPRRRRMGALGRRADGSLMRTRLKLMEYTARDGIVLRRRVTVVDPRVPMYTRLPPSIVEPRTGAMGLPLSWARPVMPYEGPAELSALAAQCEQIQLPTVRGSAGSKAMGRGVYQAVYMDPPWEFGFTVQDLVDLHLEQVMDSGLLFIWVNSDVLAAVLDALAHNAKFQYVENVCWIRKEINNRFSVASGDCLLHSKMTLLVCRRIREGGLELMHQRNPDVVFDFVRSEAGREVKPSEILVMIETILPKAKRLFVWPHASLLRPTWTLLTSTADVTRPDTAIAAAAAAVEQAGSAKAAGGKAKAGKQQAAAKEDPTSRAGKRSKPAKAPSPSTVLDV